MVELQGKTSYKSDKKVPLSVRYNIPDYYLDFDYVNKCTNSKTLERILKILRSGEEGYYPQLVQATEERLKLINPSSKLLRVTTPAASKNDLEKEEVTQLTSDLDEWLKVVNQNDTELKLMKSNKSITDEGTEIRSDKKTSQSPIPKNTKRIASTDYAAWDKYDPDVELIKMDVEETHTTKEITKKMKERDKKTVRFSNFQTQAEISLQANREREKGNEFFKQGDYQEALHYYTNSLSCKSTAAAFTNRAITFIKLKKYDDAISDCKMALKLEPDNVKAHLRIAQCLEAQKQFKKALEYADRVIVLEPNNTVAQQLLNTLRKKCGYPTKITTRLQIEEVDEEYASKPVIVDELEEPSSPKTVKSKQTPRSVLKSYRYYELVSIPGTSQMSPPFFEEIRTNSWEELREKKCRILNSTIGPLFSTTIDISSDDEVTPTVNGKTLSIAKPTISTATEKKTIISPVTKKICKRIMKKSKSKSDKINNVCYKSESNNNQNFKHSTSLIINGNNLKEENTTEERHALKGNIKIKTIPKISPAVQDPCSHGEPFNQGMDVIPEQGELNRPFNFLKEWLLDSNDTTYKRKADILRNMDLDRLPEVIGIKLDSKMFSEIVNCLFIHFTVPAEIENLKKILTNLTRVPRFNIILLFLSDTDRKCLNHMISFLDQHGNSLSLELKTMYMS